MDIKYCQSCWKIFSLAWHPKIIHKLTEQVLMAHGIESAKNSKLIQFKTYISG